MKLFIVCNSLGAGGAERVGVNLANGFTRYGHQACIITDIYQKASYPVDDAVKVLPLCPKDKGKLQRWTEAIINLRRYVKQERPDAIIGIMHLCSAVARIATIGTKVPVVMTIHHALESDTYKFSKTEQFLDRHTPCFYKATTVLTHPDKDCLGDRKNIYVMPNPVTFTAVKELPQKEKFILAAGRLTDWKYKGWDILIKAWKGLSPTLPRREGDSWWLKIAGTGNTDSINYLKSLLVDADWIQTSGGWKTEKYHIEFLGYRTDMEQLFQQASIFVLSSRSEGLPMVLIESMSQGCAPIATDFKGRTKEVLDMTSATSKKEGAQHVIEIGENGITCNPEDADALATGIQRLMKDNDLRQNIQNLAVERSKYYALQNIISMWEDLLKQIVHK